MAITVWFVPGFMGSTLSLYTTNGKAFSNGRFSVPIWGTFQSVSALPYLDILTYPGELPSDTEIRADGLPPSSAGGYSEFVTWIEDHLPAGWKFRAWPFDWRLSARDLGRALATALEQSKAAGNDNRVIAHSQGALVAWAAWAALVDDAQTAAVSKLVTFGGALYGTNSTPSVIREEEPALSLLSRAMRTLRALPAGLLATGFTAAGAAASDQITNAEATALIEIIASWPAFYDLWPDAGKLDDPGDVNRDLLWDSKTWTPALVQPNLTLAQVEITRVHSWVRQTKYLPPSGVASHIVGHNSVTASRVEPSYQSLHPSGGIAWRSQFPPGSPTWRRFQLPSWTPTNDGDGRCTLAQQRFPGYYYQLVSSQHAAMQQDPAVRQLLIAMLQQVNPAPPSPPPIQAPVPWVPPAALPNAPAFIFDNNPVSVTPPAELPRLPARVGADP